MKKRIRISAGLVVLSLITMGVIVWEQRHSQPQKQVTLFGNVDIREADLGFRVGGKVETILVEEGEAVEVGQILARLEATPYQEAVALREAEFQIAKMELERLEAGFRVEEIDIASAAKNESVVNLRHLEREVARAQRLLTTGSTTTQKVEDLESRLKAAQARHIQASERLDLLQNGYRPEDIKKARAQLKARESQVRMARTALADTALAAVEPGVLLNRLVEAGEIVSPGQAVTTVSLSGSIRVRAYVNETLLGQLQPGMRVEVTTDSAPHQPYWGRIGYISPRAEFTPRTVQSPEMRTRLVYRFHITMEPSSAGLRQGMPVSVKLPRATSAEQ